MISNLLLTVVVLLVVIIVLLMVIICLTLRPMGRDVRRIAIATRTVKGTRSLRGA